MNVKQLMEAVAALEAHDALPCRLTLEEWRQIAPYLAVRFLRPGEPLMREGEAERELYILAEGELHVTLQDTVIATQRPGAVVGEGTFFSGQPRSATVVPSTPGVAWALSWERFEAMSSRQPRLALHLLSGLAAVLAVRMREALLVGQFT